MMQKLAKHNRSEILKKSLCKLNSSAGKNFSTIIESKNERTPSPPPMNIFEELKSSLNSKLIKIDQPLIKQSAKISQIQGIHRSDLNATSSVKKLSSPIIKQTNSMIEKSKFIKSYSKGMLEKSKITVDFSSKNIIKK